MCKLPSSCPPAWGTQGRFCTACCVSGGKERIRRIRFRIPRRPKIEYSAVILALFAGKWVPKLSLTFKKPKENQCFRLQPLKNLRKINGFRPGSPWGAPGGPMGPHGPWGPIGRPWGCQWGAHGAPMGRHGVPWGAHGFGKTPGAREYIHKLPIHRHRAAVAG